MEIFISSNNDALKSMTLNLGDIHGKVAVQLSDEDGEVFAQATLGDDIRDISDERSLKSKITATRTPRNIHLKVLRPKGSKTVIKSVVLE